MKCHWAGRAELALAGPWLILLVTHARHPILKHTRAITVSDGYVH